MGIAFSDVKYYNSADIDFSDPTQNGGGEGTQIVNDTMHSIFPEISATQRENGVTLRAKVFVKNDSADRKMQDTIFYIKQDVQPEDRLAVYPATSLATHEDDEDFSTLRRYLNSPVKSTISNGVTTIDVPISDKSNYIVGDSFVILDGYFRAVHRAEITAIADSASDPSSATITMSKTYTSSATIPSNVGFVGNGEKISLSPSDVHPMWIELVIAPTNAIDAEIINQFQVGTHFDDVTA